MRRFVTFSRWSTWSKSSRRHWDCTLVLTCSDASLLKILQSVSVAFPHMDLQKIWFHYICCCLFVFVTCIDAPEFRGVNSCESAARKVSYRLQFRALQDGISEEGIVLYNIARTFSHLLLKRGSSYRAETLVSWRNEMQLADSSTSLKYQHNDLKSNSLRCEDELA